MNLTLTIIRSGAAGLFMMASIAVTNAQQSSQPPVQSGDASVPTEMGRSLLFSPDEVVAVRNAIAALTGASTPDVNNVPVEAKHALPNIYLSALVDFGDDQWTVWANGYRISPQHPAPGFRIVSVKENKVEIVTEGEQPVRFELHPYQTWRAAQHDIVEGIFP